MNFTQLIKHFRTVKAIASDLQYTHQAIYSWKKNKSIPLRTQRTIEAFTKGALKADRK